MTETPYSRSRSASLLGLAIQIVGAAAAFALSYKVQSTALAQLGWYLLGGLPLWFITLLVFRQNELAALEQLDLEELRREKEASGGGEAIFDQAGGESLSFMVAENRRRWMEKWLIPGFGLATVVYLVGFGIWRWTALPSGFGDAGWGALESQQVPLGMVALAVLMLFLFLFARYASGMGRVPEWNLLRACGSYMLGNAVAAMALIVCLGAQQYAQAATWEHALAFAIPVLMVLLAIETFLNFVLDIYRPRTPGAVPRACFDSRILGLISEPGGIAHTLAEAINYQFGFEVSHTWFYQLLQRAALPLVAVGALSLWVLSCMVVVQPHELAIVERFGRQINADDPLTPGLHWKLPSPIDRAYMYNVGQLYQIHIGAKTERAEQARKKAESEPAAVELWSDEKHRGFDHYDLLVVPTPSRGGTDEAATVQLGADADTDQQPKDVPVHLMRMNVVIQYRIPPQELATYTQAVAKPHDALRDVAWEEVLRFNASAHPDALLGELRSAAGNILKERISRRVIALGLGLEVVYVGLHGVHPAPDVAEAFREVVGAELEKVASIRQARVTENAVLARVAGDRQRALALVRAINDAKSYGDAFDEAERVLAESGVTMPADIADQLTALEPRCLEVVQARWALDRARDAHERITEEFALGIGGTVQQCAEAAEALKGAEATAQAADAALRVDLESVRAALSQRFDATIVDTLVRQAEARFGREYWSRRIEDALLKLGGEAAVELAHAQARRWQRETRAAGEVAAMENERYAFRAAPEIFKERRYLEVLVNGVMGARKYLYGFDPTGRDIHTRIEAQEQARPDIGEMPARRE